MVCYSPGLLHYRYHPLNSPVGVSKKLRYHYDIWNNNKLLSVICHAVYATKGLTIAILGRD
jgi:hypothetical protein